jgi:hypothetical protein
VQSEARVRLIQRPSKALVRLILNIDADMQADGSVTGPSGLRRQDIEHFLRTTFDPAAAVNSEGEIEIDGGSTKIALVRWEAADPHGPSLSPQQTLERLASAALLAAYPARTKAIEDWLAARPAPPAAHPKEHAWSHMAGWYAEHGWDDFYTNLWRDPRVVQELETRLRASGAWDIAARLAS